MEAVAYFPPGSDPGDTTHDGTAEPHQVTPPEAVAYHWSYARPDRIQAIGLQRDLDQAAQHMVQLVRLPSGGLQDDVGVVLVRETDDHQLVSREAH